MTWPAFGRRTVASAMWLILPFEMGFPVWCSGDRRLYRPCKLSCFLPSPQNVQDPNPRYGASHCRSAASKHHNKLVVCTPECLPPRHAGEAGLQDLCLWLSSNSCQQPCQQQQHKALASQATSSTQQLYAIIFVYYCSIDFASMTSLHPVLTMCFLIIGTKYTLLPLRNDCRPIPKNTLCRQRCSVRSGARLNRRASLCRAPSPRAGAASTRSTCDCPGAGRRSDARDTLLYLRSAVSCKKGIPW